MPAEDAPITIELVPIPKPDTSQLEPAVAEQLTEMEKLVQEGTSDPRITPEALAGLMGELGELYHAYELDDAAAASYENALRLDPVDYRWPYLKGILEQRAGRLEEAENLYRATLLIRPESLAARMRLAEVFQAQNRTTEATTLLRLLLERDPAYTAARAALGEIALAQGRPREAVEQLTRVLEEQPGADRFHYPLALAYRALGDVDKAREHLAKRGVVGIKPPDPLLDQVESMKRGERVYLLRGRKAFDAGRYADAADAFGQAVAANPESVPARINLGSALAATGDPAAAREQLEKALELDPKNPTAHFNLGTLLAAAGEDEAAVDHLKTAATANPGDPGPPLEAAKVLRRLGRLDEALIAYQRAATAAPANEQARLGWAAVLVELGRFDEARDQLVETHRDLPDAGLVAHALARLLAAVPDPELRDGEAALELALRVYGARATARHAETVALALAELGRCEEAAEWQEKVLQAAEEGGAETLAAQARGPLDRYRQGPPCRPPVG
jgi:tetratricopeptide (TPR) repeat protein